MALPHRIAPEAAPLVAVHGIHRQPEAQARAFASRAAAQGRVVIAPMFDAAEWPRYQQVVLGGRADLALLDLMQELRLAGIVRTRQISLAGYSGGAQFAHRFAMLYPHLVERLTVTAAGWYTFPEGVPFPYGLGVRKGRTRWGTRIAVGLEAFLSLPIEACVGTADNMPDENTRRRPRLDERQGPDRVTRATRWVEALSAASAARGIASRARLRLLAGCGHDFGQCVARGGLACIALPDQPAGNIEATAA
jgi:pimeloyl-ACP methyl ester carboxylesterase